ncbi:ATP-binding protein [Bacillus toyonensis]|uniref:AAA family ATPase n=1 Tax=Bacillus toyonensis TaxID=155322 RepID=UPI0021CE81A8|nr:ATP-binding protein [Bacillus toyonensis]MCU5726668.1 ATP-binding protein [Bacillus toyonensis]
MKLNSLNIKQAWGLNNLEILFGKPSGEYFENANISVLVGENGTGKTSILRLLSYAFFPEMAEKQRLYPYFHVNYEINNENYELGAFGPESLHVVRPKRVIVSSFAVFEAFKVNYSNRNENNDFVGEYAGTEYYYCGPTVSKGVASLREAIPTIVKSFYHPNNDSKFHEAISYLMTVIGYMGYPAIEISRPELRRKKRNMFTEEPKPGVELLGERLKEEIIRRGLVRLGGGKYLITPDKIDASLLELLFELNNSNEYYKVFNDLIFNKDGRELRFSQMSSGELTMFFRFFPLIDKVCDQSIILIDEPETHLHPRWIKNYINLIVKLLGNFKVHIIIATHSPLIASDVPKECIVGLKRNKNNEIVQYHVNENTLGGETSDILQDVFNIVDYSGEFTIAKKEMIKQLLHEKKIREALELYDDLSLSSGKYKFFTEIEHLLPNFRKD